MIVYFYTMLSLFIIFLSSVFLFFFMYTYMFDLNMMIEWDFFFLNCSDFSFLIFIDWFSCVFVSLVFFISGLIILYSIDYMGKDLNLRFIFLMLLFVISMMMMVLSPNLISMLLGWDGLGLVSYCLVIYYNNYYSFGAGMLTVLMNRIGDVMILCSISIMSMMGHWNYLFMSNLYNSSLITFLIVLAAMTKSAQVPFSAWLPAAMAAPTPVSALVHSSTLVTAGVYLLIRFSKFLLVYDYLKVMLLFVGIMTTLMSSVCAVYEYDIKKIIALSTLSQLGLMMSTLSIGFIELCFFHLIMHALFKALLFMCAGNFIHMSLTQDLRNISGMMLALPLTFIYFNTSNLALCGFPFLAGFYSKDTILELSCMNEFVSMFCFFMFYFSISLTVMYTIRLIYFSSKMSFNLNPSVMVLENSYYMQFSMFFLYLFSILGGSLGMSLMLYDLNLIFLPLKIKSLTLLIVICTTVFLVKFLNQSFLKVSYLLNFFMFMWFMPIFSSHFLKLKPLFFSLKSFSLSTLWLENWFMYKGLIFSLEKIMYKFVEFNKQFMLNLLFITMTFFFYMIYLYF